MLASITSTFESHIAAQGALNGARFGRLPGRVLNGLSRRLTQAPSRAFP